MKQTTQQSQASKLTKKLKQIIEEERYYSDAGADEYLVTYTYSAVDKPIICKKNDDEIRKNIETIVKSIDTNYFSVVNIDRSYV